MATGGDHAPFFDDLSDIPDGSSAGTGFGWGEGLAAESSLRDLSTRLFSAAFSRSRSGAPSPPIENPSEPRFEAPLYDIFCRCELPVRAADASPVRVFYNDVTVLGGFPTKPLLKVLHPDPSRSGELCTQGAASKWSHRQKRKAVAASSGAPETKQQKRLAAAAIKATVKDLVADVIAQDKKEKKEKKEKARLLKAAAAALAKKTIKKKLSAATLAKKVHARMIALGCDGMGYLRVACARELGSGDHGSKEDMVERLELARSTAA